MEAPVQRTREFNEVALDRSKYAKEIDSLIERGIIVKETHAPYSVEGATWYETKDLDATDIIREEIEIMSGWFELYECHQEHCNYEEIYTESDQEFAKRESEYYAKLEADEEAADDYCNRMDGRWEQIACEQWER